MGAAPAPLPPPSRPAVSWLTRRIPPAARPGLGVVGALGALVAAVFWPLLRGRFLYERDIAVLFHPQAEAFFATVRQGSWPLWNPFPGFGEPMLANSNFQVLYPPTWLLLLLPPAPYYTLYVLLHLLFGGLGLYALARHLGVSRPAALAGAAVFVTCGPTLSFVNVWNHLAGACWMSWVVLASLRAVRARSAEAALVWGAAVAAQVYAGSPDLCLLTLVATLAAWAAVPGAIDPARPRALLSTIALAVVAAVALSAAQWMPTLAAARAGSRSGFPFEQRAFWSVHPLSLGQLLAPLPLREIVNYSPWAGDLFDVWEPFVASLYLGAAAAALAAAALGGPRSRPGRLLALFTLGTLAVALGRHTPVYGAITRALPPLAMFRFPAKAMVLVGWSWALLVALGADRWWRDPAGSWRRMAVTSSGVLAVFLAGAAVRAAISAAHGTLPVLGPAAEGGDVVARRIVLAVAWAAVCATLALAATVWPRGGRAMAAAAMALAVADLGLAHRDLNHTAPAAFFRYRPEALRLLPPRPEPRLFVWDYIAHKPRTERSLLLEFLRLRPGFPTELGRALALQSYLYPPSYVRWGLYGGFDRDLLGFAPPAISDLVGLVSRIHGTVFYPRLLALGAVDAVVALHDDGVAGLTPLGQVEGPLQLPVRVFGVPSPRPRAYLVGEAKVAAGTEGLRALFDASFDPARTVVLEDGAGAPGAPSAAAAARALRVGRDAPDRFEADVDQDGPGWLVRVVTHDPGWRASLDGAPVPLLRANHAFQAVLVPAGHHHVAIVYRPSSVLAGLALSAVALPLAALAFARARARARRGRAPAAAAAAGA